MGVQWHIFLSGNFYDQNDWRNKCKLPTRLLHLQDKFPINLSVILIHILKVILILLNIFINCAGLENIVLNFFIEAQFDTQYHIPIVP